MAGCDARSRMLAYSLVSVPMLRLPDAELVEHLRSAEFAACLDAVEAAYPSEDMARGLALLRECAPGLDEASLDELARDRTYLFRALAPGVGAPPPYESSWRASVAAESVMADLAECYRGAQASLAPSAHERLDHLGVELMFMTRLAARELDAEEDELAAARAQQAGFFFAHLEPWAAEYARAALPCASTGFFQGILLVLAALVEADASQLRAAA